MARFVFIILMKYVSSNTFTQLTRIFFIKSLKTNKQMNKAQKKTKQKKEQQL
jgi:hypothetical protein